MFFLERAPVPVRKVIAIAGAAAGFGIGYLGIRDASIGEGAQLEAFAAAKADRQTRHVSDAERSKAEEIINAANNDIAQGRTKIETTVVESAYLTDAAYKSHLAVEARLRNLNGADSQIKNDLAKIGVGLVVFSISANSLKRKPSH